MTFKKTYLVLSAVAFSILFFSNSAISQDEVIGPISLANRFPKMQNNETCNQAYNDFKEVASPIKACHDMEKFEFEAQKQQAIIDSLKGLKGKQVEAKSNEAKSNLNDANAKVKEFKSNCPKGKKFLKLVSQAEGKIKNVCDKCNNKWPGEIGPCGGTPCK